MNNEYKEYKNYIKIDKLLNIDWTITNKQLVLLMELSKEIKTNESIIENISNSTEYHGVFLKQLLYFEQNRNSAIEGSQTQFDELFGANEKIFDNDTWETKNLIRLGTEILNDIKNDVFSFNIDTIINIHKKLYSNENYKTSFDNAAYVKKIKPGYILKSGDPINWIGFKTSDREHDLKNALLIPVIPEDKYNKLKQLIEETRKKLDSNSMSILEISRFHVIFEGIHPFADGNGRLGRLIMMALFQMTNITTNTILPFSEYIYKNKDEYIRELNKAQVSGDYQEWNFYFIELMIQSKRIHQQIVTKMATIFRMYIPLIKGDKEVLVFNKFLKHIKLNKEMTIKRLISEGMSQATAYRSFEKVAKTIGAKKIDGYYVFEKMWSIYTNK